jgi:hypothetical protein
LPEEIIINRITDAHLQALCDRINRATGSPAQPYVKQADGTHAAQIGCYHLSHAYGGVNLQRMCNDAGGVSTPLHYGHVPKRDLANRLQAFLAGIEAARSTVEA